MLENVVRTDLKEGEEGWLSGVAKAMREKSDLAFGKWVEGTQLMDAGGDLTALRLDTPEAKKRAQAEQRTKANLLKMSEVMGITTKGKSVKQSGLQKFDKEGFEKLLLAASNDKSFAVMTQMIAGLSKVGKISAEDAERYKMDISKEQAAGTAPVIINNAPTTNNNAGVNSVLMGSNANDPMNQILKDW